MHLALVRDRPKGEAKNIRGRAATQRECRAGNLIPTVGALVVTVTSSVVLSQSLGLSQAAEPQVDSWKG